MGMYEMLSHMTKLTAKKRQNYTEHTKEYPAIGKKHLSLFIPFII